MNFDSFEVLKGDKVPCSKKVDIQIKQQEKLMNEDKENYYCEELHTMKKPFILVNSLKDTPEFNKYLTETFRQNLVLQSPDDLNISKQESCSIHTNPTERISNRSIQLQERKIMEEGDCQDQKQSKGKRYHSNIMKYYSNLNSHSQNTGITQTPVEPQFVNTNGHSIVIIEKDQHLH